MPPVGKTEFGDAGSHQIGSAEFCERAYSLHCPASQSIFRAPRSLNTAVGKGFTGFGTARCVFR